MQAYRCDGTIETPDHIRLTQKISLPTGSKVEVIILKASQGLPQNTAQVEEWLKACDDFAGSVQGQFNAVEDLRQLREERADQ